MMQPDHMICDNQQDKSFTPVTYFQHAHFLPIVGAEKRRINWSIVTCQSCTWFEINENNLIVLGLLNTKNSTLYGILPFYKNIVSIM